MMPATVAELAAKRSVAVANLFQFEFASRTVRFWNGVGILTAGGQDWEASGDLISVGGMEYVEGLGAGPATFTLAGTTPEIIEAAIRPEQEVLGRPVSAFIQFLTDAYVPLDNPIAVWVGRMDVPRFSGDVKTQTISLGAETLFAERIRAPYGLQTDRDHQSRWPGDLGMQFMPFLRNKTVTWLRG